jgi:cytochrome c553
MNTRRMSRLGVTALMLGTLISTSAMADGADSTKLWSDNCAKCHGDTGSADSKAAKMLKVRDITQAEVSGAFDRDRMIKSVTDGVPKPDSDKLAMKGYADKLSAEEIAALVDYMYKLAGVEAEPAPAAAEPASPAE